MTVHECYDFGSDAVLRFWKGELAYNGVRGVLLTSKGPIHGFVVSNTCFMRDRCLSVGVVCD